MQNLLPNIIAISFFFSKTTITAILITFSLTGIQIQESIDKMVIVINFTVGVI